MSIPAHAVPPGESWSEDDWARALESRPDLLQRLDEGDSSALAEMLELIPGVVAKVSDARTFEQRRVDPYP